MSDKELLGFAAKAAGLEVVFRSQSATNGYQKDRDFFILENTKMWANPLEWNPLINDGDALRMAVKLRMTIRLEDPAAVIAGWADNQYVPFTKDGNGPWFWKEWGRVVDPYAATRRAIVRAAAEIGKAMP